MMMHQREAANASITRGTPYWPGYANLIGFGFGTFRGINFQPKPLQKCKVITQGTLKHTHALTISIVLGMATTARMKLIEV